MAVIDGWPAVSGAATFQEIRKSLAGQVVRDAAGVMRKGIFPTSTAALVTGTATMNVSVASFVAALDRNGLVLVANDGAANVLLSSAPASGSRWSVIYVKQQETEAPFSDAANGPVLGRVESTTSASAARALLPAGALELALVQVSAGSATTNAAGVTITQTAPFTAMAGGVVWLRGQTEQDAWAPADGSLAYRVDTGRYMTRTGGAWVPVVRSATYTLAAGGAPDAAVISGTVATTLLAAETTDSSFVTGVSGLTFTVRSGLYLVTLHLAVNAPVTGRTFVEVDKGSTVIGRNNATNGDDATTVTTQVLIESDGLTIVGKLFKTSGGTSNLTGRVTLTKLA